MVEKMGNIMLLSPTRMPSARQEKELQKAKTYLFGLSFGVRYICKGYISWNKADKGNLDKK